MLLAPNNRQPSQMANFQKIKSEKNTRNMNANTLIDSAEGTKSGICLYSVVMYLWLFCTLLPIVTNTLYQENTICLNINNQTKKRHPKQITSAFSDYQNQPFHFEDFWSILVLTQEIKSLDPVVVLYLVTVKKSGQEGNSYCVSKIISGL